MKLLILLAILTISIQATTKELIRALSERCQLDRTVAKNLLLKYQVFTITLELLFRLACNNPANCELLRELNATNIWVLLTRTEPTILKQLRKVREALEGKLIQSEACMAWWNTLLGDQDDTFTGSYLELLLMSLSATESTRIVELTNKQMFFVLTQTRKMHFEREYLFLSRNEVMHEIYIQYLQNFISLVNLPVGAVTSETTTLNIFYHFQSEVIPSSTPSSNTALLEKYLDPIKDFIIFNNRMHLRKTKNFSFVYGNWLRILAVIPDESVRRKYFDEGRDVVHNFRRVEKIIIGLYLQKNKPFAVVQWSKDELINLTVTLDLIASLVSYEGQKICMINSKHMLLVVLSRYLRFFG